jgi:hypothetical protein
MLYYDMDDQGREYLIEKGTIQANLMVMAYMASFCPSELA